MKYWNKQPHIRRNWHPVTLNGRLRPSIHPHGLVYGVFDDHYMVSFDPPAEPKRWCQQKPGGKFFSEGNRWYFERKEDALWFALVWT